MNKYDINSELSEVSKIKSSSMNYLILSFASLYLKDTYQCLKKRKDLHVDVVEMDGFRLYVIIPNDLGEGLHPCNVNYHGGGFVYRGYKNHFHNPADYAVKTGSIVIYTDYRLSYNHRYGVPLSDCIKAYEWALSHAEEYHIDIHKMSLSGDSAGGCLALKVNEYIHQNNLIQPKGLLLIYPVVDCSLRTESMKKYSDTPVWDNRSNRKMWKTYLKGNKEESILDKDLSYIENCYIELTEFDCLHDEGYLLYQKIKGNGITVLNDTKGTFHGYDIDTSPSIVLDAIDKRCDFLNKING